SSGDVQTITASGTRTKVETGHISLRLDAVAMQHGIDLESQSAAIGAAITVATTCVTRRGATLPAGARISVDLSVDRKGKVKKAAATGLDDRHTARCVARAFQKLSFAPSP